MNIFYLDPSPRKSAQAHVDRHVVKMVLEYAQLLSTAHRVLDKDPIEPDLLYAMTHKNHPSAIWARSSEAAYSWLYALFCETSHEYAYRYRKNHLTFTKLRDVLCNIPKAIPKDKLWTPPTPAMPDEYKIEGDVLLSYRNYYTNGKQHLAVWTRRNKPDWYIPKEI